jgi:hypothetical protein
MPIDVLNSLLDVRNGFRELAASHPRLILEQEGDTEDAQFSVRRCTEFAVERHFSALCGRAGELVLRARPQFIRISAVHAWSPTWKFYAALLDHEAAEWQHEEGGSRSRFVNSAEHVAVAFMEQWIADLECQAAAPAAEAKWMDNQSDSTSSERAPKLGPTAVRGGLQRHIEEFNSTERLILQAMFEKFTWTHGGHLNCPSARQISKAAVGLEPSGTIKNALARLVARGVLGNRKHDGARGGYYLTEAARALSAQKY